jgi:hypothetical protein
MGSLKTLFRRNALEHDIDREFRFHIEELTRQYIARAMSPEEAHRQAILARDLPRIDEIRLDPHTITYTLVSAVLVTLLCGLLPAIRSTSRSIAGALAHTSGKQVSARNPMQWALVGVQVALAVTLLVGAGLLLRSFQELARVVPGFDVSHILTLRISATWAETADMKGLTQRCQPSIGVLVRQCPIPSFWFAPKPSPRRWQKRCDVRFTSSSPTGPSFA